MKRKQKPRKWISVQRSKEIDRVVERERKRLVAKRGKDEFVGKAEAVRALIFRGSTVTPR